MVSRKTCRFCNRKIPVTKYKRHACNDKKIARDWYAEYRARVLADGTPDMLLDLERFPDFHSWDLAIVTGALHYPDYPYSPIAVAPSAFGQQSLDDGEGVTGTGKEEHEGAGLLVHPGQASEGGFGEPRLDDAEEHLRPSERAEEGEKKTLKQTAEHVAARAIDVVDGISEKIKVRISLKEKGWLPIVSIQHGIQMALFKAKDNNTKFKLSRDQKKILAHSCYATFGESPLSKLKVDGDTDLDVHIVIAAIDVYGEFWAENYGGLMESGSSIWKKIKNRKGKKDVETTQQEN